MNSRKGFTLIEMLIVVAIIAILAGSVLVGLGPVQRQGRDSRRVSDLRQVQNALELYYNRNAAYPTAGSGGALNDWTSLKSALTGAGIGINNVPSDPRNEGSYYYRYWSDGSSYVLGAQLEDTGSSQLKSDIDNPISVGTVAASCGDASGNSENPPIFCISL